MKSARNAIDIDSDLHLKYLPAIEGLLKSEITLLVKKDFPNYHDMTLVQYAIAKRKPKTLSFMIDKLKELQVNANDILFPKGSNTRGGIIQLAVEFGSLNFYDSLDNSCLRIIVDKINGSKSDSKTNQSNADTENKPALNGKNTLSSLITAIRLNNNEAIKILIDNNADLLYPFGNCDKIQEELISEMPIMTLFKLHDDLKELDQIFKEILDDEKREKVYKFFQDNSFVLLSKMNNILGAKAFISSKFKYEDDTIKPLPQTPIFIQPEYDEEKCYKCHERETSHICEYCGGKFCDNCINNHNCK